MAFSDATTLAQVPSAGAESPQLVNIDPIELLIPASGYINCPAMPVPAGALVRVKAANGTNAGNANPIAVGLNRQAAVSGPNTIVEPKYEIIYPVDDLGRIWIAGSVGDGVIISVRGR